MYKLEVGHKDYAKNDDGTQSLVIRIDPVKEELTNGRIKSAEIFLPLDASESILLDKKYYLVSDDEWTPPEATP